MGILYYEVKKDIERRINEGYFKKEDYLPSESELQNEYNVSRTTIRKAIGLLVDDGLITIVRGKGTKVTPSRIKHNISTLMSFTKLMHEQGLRPSIKNVKVQKVEPSEEVASKLELPGGEKIFKIYRERIADNEPISINISYISCNKIPFFIEGYFEEYQSLYQILENKHQVIIQSTTDEVTAIKADKQLASTLNINENEPVLFIERLAYTSDNTLLELSKIFLRSDRYKHVITLRKK